jgi:LAO/AO transport system kinase
MSDERDDASAADATEAVATRLLEGDRTALSRAITLVESKRDADQVLARALVQRVLTRTGNATRIGITGAPGVGKSTLIEALGSALTARGRRVAVLAVDPSSTVSGGAILGDKTRMLRLSADPAAFIRPSPSGTTLGGIAAHTREAMLLCEAAGYDVVLVETVGIGQSETAVADMVDTFVLLVPPGAGDELQGLKKGVIELADVIAINKADGTSRQAALATAAEFRRALQILTPAGSDWTVPVLAISGASGEALEALWATIEKHRASSTSRGGLAAKRAAQQVKWLRVLVEERLTARLRSDGLVRDALRKAEEEVAQGVLAPLVAADRIVSLVQR